MSLLTVDNLSVEFADGRRPVEDVTFSVREGESVAVVGESGCGKTITALAVMELLPDQARIVHGNVAIHGFSEKMSALRGKVISMVFQDPMTSLNPVIPVGWQIAEMYQVHERAGSRAARRKAMTLLERVGIPDPDRAFRMHQHQFSGGMRQRAIIAMAIALRPKLLIADEPTTALDVTVQAQILELLIDLRRETGMTTILITHDLGVVAAMADTVLLMYAGRVMERASVDSFYLQPRHPYGRALLRAVPRIEVDGTPRAPIAGAPPNLDALPAGCRFHPRCIYAVDRCRTESPELRVVGEGLVACHLAERLDA